MLVTGTIAFLAFVWYLARGMRQLQAKPPPQKGLQPARYSDPGTCARILACKGYDSTGVKNLYNEVRSRAIPNQRLVHAYGIDNSFTTTEAKRRREFNEEAGKAIKMTEAKVGIPSETTLLPFSPKKNTDVDVMQWQEVATFANELVRQAVSPSKLTTSGETKFAILDSLTRSVCLKIIFHVLFKLDPLNLDDGNISTITERINSLWIQSKNTETPVESDKLDLQEALARVIPQMKRSNARENPLNLILPAYETLWRVVLSGFLQVTFVKGVDPTLRSVLAQFLANPTITVRRGLVRGPEASTVSVDLIVKEALRLYPSVKRVYRQFHMDNGAGPEDVAADVESCQRTKALWGANADRFVPSRWINATDEAKKSYMAFGVSPFVCPAQAEFGPMMIGILVAAFADQVSSDGWHLELDESSWNVAQRGLDKALNGEEPLVSDRSTYEGIRIIKKWSS